MEKRIEITGEGENAVASHQQFVNRQGQPVKVVKGNSQSVPIGKAYAFFYCDASKDQIEAELLTIRRLTQTPSDLELDLIEGTDIVTSDKDSELYQISELARDAGLNYTLTASHKGRTNRVVSESLATLMSQTYQIHYTKKVNSLKEK